MLSVFAFGTFKRSLKPLNSFRRMKPVMLKCFFASYQAAETSLDVRHPVPLFVPVRTKKRYFIPPAVGLKGKREQNTEAKARSAGIVIRQQYIERPINIACTGNIAHIRKQQLVQLQFFVLTTWGKHIIRLIKHSIGHIFT